MNQVGETKVFSLSVVPPASAKVYSYVWNFWDGTVAVTTEPSVQKVLNMGGNPTLAGRKLTYTCIPVLADGQSTAIVGEVQVNNPPSIVPSPSVTLNDRYFPYATNLTVTAYDLENDPMSFLYYLNGTAIGGGATTAVGVVNGTWNGTLAGTYNAYQNVFSTTVGSARTVKALVVDNQGGTTTVDFALRGKVAPPPSVSPQVVVGSVTADSTTRPAQRIGVGQTVDFSVYAKDEAGGTFGFLWKFAGSLGWTTLPSFTNGTATLLADGGYRSTVVRDIADETPGFKSVECRVTNNATNKFVTVPFDVELTANQVATNGTLAVKVNGADEAEPISVTAGDKLQYSLTVTDPDADIVTYKWTFTLPAGAIPASPPQNSLVVWGQKALLDTTGWPAGNILTTVLATDRLGGVTSVTVPLVAVS